MRATYYRHTPICWPLTWPLTWCSTPLCRIHGRGVAILIQAIWFLLWVAVLFMLATNLRLDDWNAAVLYVIGTAPLAGMACSSSIGFGVGTALGVIVASIICIVFVGTEKGRL